MHAVTLTVPREMCCFLSQAGRGLRSHSLLWPFREGRKSMKGWPVLPEVPSSVGTAFGRENKGRKHGQVPLQWSNTAGLCTLPGA